jgi:hypothetical protein
MRSKRGAKQTDCHHKAACLPPRGGRLGGAQCSRRERDPPQCSRWMLGADGFGSSPGGGIGASAAMAAAAAAAARWRVRMGTGWREKRLSPLEPAPTSPAHAQEDTRTHKRTHTRTRTSARARTSTRTHAHTTVTVEPRRCNRGAPARYMGAPSVGPGSEELFAANPAHGAAPSRPRGSAPSSQRINPTRNRRRGRGRVGCDGTGIYWANRGHTWIHE